MPTHIKDGYALSDPTRDLLKLADKGLVDVERFAIAPLWVA